MRGTPLRRPLAAVCVVIAWLMIFLAGGSLLAACQQGQDASDSGVEGQVMIGPMCPVVQAGQECPDQPFEANLEIEDPSGDLVARGGSDKQGQFHIPLEPGEYVLKFASPNPGGPPTAAPIPFRVEDGAWTTLTVLVDSGIR